ALWAVFRLEARATRVLTRHGGTAAEPRHPRAHGEARLRRDRRLPPERPAAVAPKASGDRPRADRRARRRLGRARARRDHGPALLRGRRRPLSLASECAGSGAREVSRGLLTPAVARDG